MRRVLRRVRHAWRTRPSLIPFVPLIARVLLRRPRRTAAAASSGVRPALVVTPLRRARPSGLTVFSVIRNGTANGYPFIEAYGSWLEYCERLVVLEGESDDGTDEALADFARIDSRVEVVSRPWPERSEMGSAIARFTDDAVELAAAGSERLMYVQADEIYTSAQRALVRDWTSSAALEFAGCVNFWNSLDTILDNEFPMRYVRLFPAAATVRSIGDGFSFDVEGTPVRASNELFLHYGWCFPEQILQKHASHGRLYRGDPGYRMRGWLAGLMLDQRVYDRKLLDALAPQYRPVPYTGEHPSCMRHLVGRDRYDPAIGLELLAAGARW